MAPPLLRTGPSSASKWSGSAPSTPRPPDPARPKRQGRRAKPPREQEIARNPRAAAECRDFGKVFDLAKARPPAAFLHAHDPDPPDVKLYFTYRKTSLLTEKA